jgi:hypothetical protein
MVVSDASPAYGALHILLDQALEYAYHWRGGLWLSPHTLPILLRIMPIPPVPGSPFIPSRRSWRRCSFWQGLRLD